MSLFVLDTAGDQKLIEQKSSNRLTLINRSQHKILDEKNIRQPVQIIENVSDDEDDYFGLPPPSVDLSTIIKTTISKTAKFKDQDAKALENIKVSIDEALAAKALAKSLPYSRRIIDLDHSDFNTETGKFDDEQMLKVNVSHVVAESRLKPGMEQLKAQPKMGLHKLRQVNKRERAKTKGADWYNLPATEKTEEINNELKILQMRSVLDPKHFYKKNDLKVLPKYFQIGTVLPSPLDYYNERNTRKNKKHSLVEELIADSEFQTYNKRKYKETLARKGKYAHKKAVKKMKKLKKNK